MAQKRYRIECPSLEVFNGAEAVLIKEITILVYKKPSLVLQAIRKQISDEKGTFWVAVPHQLLQVNFTSNGTQIYYQFGSYPAKITEVNLTPTKQKNTSKLKSLQR